MKIEIRSATEAVIEGYVNAVERDSRLLPRCMCPGAENRFVEQVKAGAFRKALDSAKNIELRFNHEKVIGGTASNLELKEDNIGLYARAVISDTEVIAKARVGELRGWSFGFNCVNDSWENIGDDRQRRYLNEIRLHEVSVLDKTPAYVGTSIEMRDFDRESEKAAPDAFERRGFGENFEVIDNSTDKENISVDLYRKKTEILRMKGEKGNFYGQKAL